MKLDGPIWKNLQEDLLPKDLDPDARTTALQELRNIPEYFYSSTNLPIVTPDNVDRFMALVHKGRVLFISLFSGSARLALTAVANDEFVLPPIDLRYGWDLQVEKHRRQVSLLILHFDPEHVCAEPRCKYWSKAGCRRDPAKTELMRSQEFPMLTWLQRLCMRTVRNQRDVLLENPKDSALWTKSPLERLQSVDSFEQHSKNTSQCAFSPEPDGQRSAKATKLKASFPVPRSTKKCVCTKGHIVLQGYDKETHKSRCAAAALFSHRFCRALCDDMIANSIAKRKKKNHHSSSLDDTTTAPAATQINHALPERLQSIPTSTIRLTGQSYAIALCNRNSFTACICDLIETMPRDTISPIAYLRPQPVSSEEAVATPPLVTLETVQSLVKIMEIMYVVHHIIGYYQAALVPSGRRLLATLPQPDLYMSILFEILSSSEFKITLKDYLDPLPEDTVDDLDLQYDHSKENTPKYVFFFLVTPTEQGMTSLDAQSTHTEAPRRRLGQKTTAGPSPSPPPGLEETAPKAEDKVAVNPQRLPKPRPSSDLKDFARKLCTASDKDRESLLRLLHERFWHAGPGDMAKMLEAMLVPRHIVLEGIAISQKCSDCARYRHKTPRPLVKASMSVTFNHQVQHDLFFLWDEPFMMLIDECIRYKVSDHLENKTTLTLLKTILDKWIRYFGPMTNLLTDQEGGLMSTEATIFFDRFRINRLLTGTDASFSKGVVERHIGLQKHGMLLLKRELNKAGIVITHGELTHEISMAQNLLLDYNGGTAQSALTGQNSHFWDADSDVLQSTASATSGSPDYAEIAIRTRLISKQCILQSIIEDRIARAQNMKQYKHTLEFLLPGTICDVYRKPNRKDEYGWHGPCELVSIQRAAGSCIIVHNGVPLIVALSHVRRHLLVGLLVHLLEMMPYQQHSALDFVNYQQVTMQSQIEKILFLGKPPTVPSHDESSFAEVLMKIMEIVEGEPPGKLYWIGLSHDHGVYTWRPDENFVRNHPLIQLAETFSSTFGFQSLHGVMYGYSLRRTHAINGSTFQVTLRWPRDDRLSYSMSSSTRSAAVHYHGREQDHIGTVIYYSFADLDDHREVVHLPPDDFDDISQIDPESVPTSPTGIPSLDQKKSSKQPPLHEPDLSLSPEKRSSASTSGPSVVPPGLHDRSSSRTTGVRQMIPQPTPINSDSPMPGEGQGLPPPAQLDTTDFDTTPGIPQQLPSPTSLHPPVPPETPAPDSIDIHNDQKRVPLGSSGSLGRINKRTRFEDDQGGRSSSSTSGAATRGNPPAAPLPPPAAHLPIDTDDSQKTIEYDDQGEIANPGDLPAVPTATDSQPTTDDSQRTIEYDATGAAAIPLPTDTSQQTADTEDSQRTITYDDDGNAADPSQDPSRVCLNNGVNYVAECGTHVYWLSHEKEYGYKQALSMIYTDADTSNHFVKEIEDNIGDMTRELFADLLATLPEDKCYVYQDLVTGEILRVDADTGLLTEAEMIKYAQLVYDADFKELKSFTDHKVFTTTKRQPRDNVVDCVWIRKWKVHGKEVKSRMCARGCFDKQKNLIERHSSTATRLSQRIIVSMSMCDGIIYTQDDWGPVNLESLDISTAFLQGLSYKDLAAAARQLGYESRIDRRVVISPPENVWRHFRRMSGAPPELRVKDSARHLTLLLCLKAMYGFADAPLMFQLALLQYLVQSCEAITSLFDSNFLYWIMLVDGRWVVILVITAHVDDLQVAGSRKMLDWLHHRLEDRFGALKRQVLPYTHAGIEQSNLGTSCIRLHQDDFCSKLSTAPVGAHRAITDPLDIKEKTTFRSLTCSCLWACQTQLQEVCQVTSLQQALSEPTVEHLMSINTVIKRLKSPTREHFGIFFCRMNPPYRVLTVSDASPANKKSNYATEGLISGLGEDRLQRCDTDKDDFLNPDSVHELSGKIHLLQGSSTKSKRVSHSTSHAETNAAARGIPIGQIIQLRLCEPDLRILELPQALTPMRLLEMGDIAHRQIPHDHYIDCMDLWELSCGMRGIPQDKSQRLGILAMREERRSHRLRRLFHVITHFMLADPMTKHVGYVSKSLYELLTSGHWTVADKIRVRHQFGSKKATNSNSIYKPLQDDLLASDFLSLSADGTQVSIPEPPAPYKDECRNDGRQRILRIGPQVEFRNEHNRLRHVYLPFNVVTSRCCACAPGTLIREGDMLRCQYVRRIYYNRTLTCGSVVRQQAVQRCFHMCCLQHRLPGRGVQRHLRLCLCDHEEDEDGEDLDLPFFPLPAVGVHRVANFWDDEHPN